MCQPEPVSGSYQYGMVTMVWQISCRISKCDLLFNSPILGEGKVVTLTLLVKLYRLIFLKKNTDYEIHSPYFLLDLLLFFYVFSIDYIVIVIV